MCFLLLCCIEWEISTKKREQCFVVVVLLAMYYNKTVRFNYKEIYLKETSSLDANKVHYQHELMDICWIVYNWSRVKTNPKTLAMSHIWPFRWIETIKACFCHPHRPSFPSNHFPFSFMTNTHIQSIVSTSGIGILPVRSKRLERRKNFIDCTHSTSLYFFTCARI